MLYIGLDSFVALTEWLIPFPSVSFSWIVIAALAGMLAVDLLKVVPSDSVMVNLNGPSYFSKAKIASDFSKYVIYWD